MVLYCQKCDKYPVKKGFRFCAVCKVQVEKEIHESNYLTKTMFPKKYRGRNAKEAPERQD